MMVLNAIDQIDEWTEKFKGKRVGLLTHAPAVTADYRRSADVICSRLNVVMMWGPEHGLDGVAQAGHPVDGGVTDKATGLPVYSLFGDRTAPTEEELAQVDVVLCDFCDIGARFYTYMYTMSDSMIACAKAGVPFVVLDRFNPQGGEQVEGTLLKAEFANFCGRFPIPIRFGLTIGEAAILFNTRFGIGCDLTVLPVRNWTRDQWFEDTGRCWVNPSPNIPNPESCHTFLGTCFLECTNISEGRGTTRPFEIIGAPFIDPMKLAERFNRCRLPGIMARPCYFEPAFHKYEHLACGGIQLLPTERRKANFFEAGIHLLEILKQDYGEFEIDNAAHCDNLLGSVEYRTGKLTAQELMERGREESRDFQKSVQDLLLYR